MEEEARTFRELGISFPLFDAPAKFAMGYLNEVICDICQQNGPGFELWIGDYIMIDCPKCGLANGLSVDEIDPPTCWKYNTSLPSVKFAGKKARACYHCLRVGKVSFTQDTEFGMIGWRQVLSGVTHGVPNEIETDFETESLEDDWTGVRVPVNWMTELTRTPTYSTIQGEQWQFCCKRPMVYIGEWQKEDFIAHAPNGDGKAFFNEVVIGSDEGLSEEGLWEDIWSGNLHDDFAVYVFHCPDCESYQAHWDML